MFLLCFLWASIIQTLRAESPYEAKVRLESFLLKDYRRETRPVLEYQDNVTITVGISLYHIRDMDDKNQILTLSLWIRQSWTDPRLAWEPSQFAGTNTTHIHPDKLWVPDLKVYNEINRRPNSGLDQFKTRAVVSHKGRVYWWAPGMMRLSCRVDVTYFPYDTQECKMKIGSWTHDGFSVDVIPENYTVDISKSPSNPEWILVSSSVKKNIQFYPCCPEPYPDVTYTIRIKRREQNYWMNFIYPGIFLTVMTMMTFVTPAPDTGERISLVLTSLVSMFFFLKLVGERTPTSDTIPLLSTYFVMLSFEIALIFYSVCISLNAYHKHPALGDMPGYVRAVVLNRLGRFWGLSQDGEAIKNKLEALGNSSLMRNKVRHQLKTSTVVRFSKSSSSVSMDEPSDLDCKINALCKVHARNFANGDESSFSAASGPSVPAFGAETSGKVLSKRKQSRSSLRNVRKPDDPAVCTCQSLLPVMVTANERLLSSVREIGYVARRFEKTSYEKEHWLLAASILDRVFVVLFILLFILFTLVNFLG